MKRSKVVDLLIHAAGSTERVLVKGWVRTRRDSKEFCFIELNDGSCLKNLQIIAEADLLSNYQAIKLLGTGSSIAVEGELIPSPGAGQKWELKAHRIDILGTCPDTYPLQKKRHSDEFLRTIAHLRPRTNKYSAMFRIRSKLALAIHSFFQERGFSYIHTPILTASDCEGAGAMFTVTTLDMQAVPKKDGQVDFTEDFFGKEAKLTVSGQLSGEMLALSLGDIYTFGPTFRAENSNTPRHIAEFWMIEPELAFADLKDDMDLGEEFIRSLVRYALAHCADDLALFAQFVDKDLLPSLEHIANSAFERVPYTEAIAILQGSGESFEYPPLWGSDLQTEHERYLTERHFKGPVIIYNYPKDIKAFYMRLNDDGKTVAAMDILLPRVGEIIGGSQREERYEVLETRMQETGLNLDSYWWYLDSRRFGTVPHSGFGLGFERFLMMLTGTTNIRDVIPFPRTPKHLEF
ncbi:MAG TPA: asparagine--tRNA ligase [Gammaproteobacteria bacterium]|nr:asparagine--tRNA ligase [Gammaproteobacteria bacterium]